jgi:hypothetical protein
VNAAARYRRPKSAEHDTCPLQLCAHPVLHHDRDETPGPPVERCTVDDCGCTGIPEAWFARAEARLNEMREAS